MSETTMSEYIKGFDAGYGYAINEVVQYIRRHDYDPAVTGPLLNLLAHLKMEDKDPQKLEGIAHK
jgi:hypothetical protein